MRICALSHCTVLFNVQLIFLGGWLLPEGKRRSSGSGGKRKWEELGEVEGGEVVVRIV